MTRSESFRIRPRALEGADSWAERLRAAGLKATGSRLAILTYLESDRGHPSAQQIFAALRPHYPSLSLSTVYETLDAFMEAGIFRAVAGEGALLRVDGTTYPHDHAVCRECGRIFDVADGLWPHPDPPQRLPGGLAVLGMRVEYEVICSECVRDATSGARPHDPVSRARTGSGADGHPGVHHREKETAGGSAERRSARGDDRRRGGDRRRSRRPHDRLPPGPGERPDTNV